MVPGRVLVLLRVYPDDAGHVRVHASPAAAQEHGGDQEDGQQALHDTGQLLVNSFLEMLKSSAVVFNQDAL